MTSGSTERLSTRNGDGKIKLLYLTNKFPSVSETFIVNEIFDMLRAGADVRVFSFGKPENLSDLPKWEAIPDMVKYFSFPPETFGRKLIDLGAAALRMLGRGQLRALAKCLFDKENEGFSRYQLLMLADALNNRSWNPDIIHCHFGTIGRLAAVVKCKGLTKAKITVTLHGYDVSKSLQESPAGFYAALFREADRIFAVSEFFLERVRALGAPSAKLSLFHMGVECDDFGARAEPIQPDAAFHLVSIGRMTEKKGHEYAIRGFARALRNNPELDMRFSIVGDGPLLPKMQALVKELGIEQRVTLLGARQHHEALALLAKGNVFILHSITAADGDMEGIPVALMEAMAHGLPVIATRHSGIPELVEDKITGFLVDERDEIGLAELLAEIGSDPLSLSKLTEAARAKVKLRFNRTLQAQWLYASFKEIQNYSEQSHAPEGLGAPPLHS